jgi:hypothetical protein
MTTKGVKKAVTSVLPFVSNDVICPKGWLIFSYRVLGNR